MQALKSKSAFFLLTDIFLLLLLVILAFVVRYRAFLDLPLDFHSDDAIYMSMARAFYEHRFEALLHSHWRPFYPIVATLFYPLTHDWAITARYVSLFFGSLLIVPVYLLSKPLVGRMLAVLAAVLILSYQPLITASVRPLTESLFVFLFWLGLFFVTSGFRLNKKKLIFFGGITWSLAFLTRNEGIILLAGFIIAVLAYILIKIFREHILKSSKKYKYFYLSKLSSVLYVEDERILIFSKKYFIIAAVCSFLISYYISVKTGIHLFPSLLSHGLFLFTGLLIFSLIYAILLIFCFRLTRQVFKDIKFYLLAVVLFLTGFLLTYSPYKLALDNKFDGSPLFSKFWTFHIRPGNAFELTSNGESTWAQDVWGRRTVNPHSAVFQYSPGDFPPLLLYDILLTGTANRITVFYERYLSQYFSALEVTLVVIGGFWAIRNFLKRKEIFFTGTVLLFFFSGMSFVVPTANERYLYSLLPFFSILITMGIKVLFEGKRLQRLLLPAIVVLGVLSLVIFQSSLYFPYKSLLAWPGSFPQRLAGTTMVDFWLQKNNPGSRVMAKHESVGFYSRSLIVYMPSVRTLPELLDYAKKWQVNYIVTSPAEISPGLEFLYLKPQDYPGIKLEFTGSDMVIYKVV